MASEEGRVNDAEKRIHAAFVERCNRRLNGLGFSGDLIRDPGDAAKMVLEQEFYGDRDFNDFTRAVKLRLATTDEHIAYLESDLPASEWISREIRRYRIIADFREERGREPTDAELMVLIEREEQSENLREGLLVIKGGMDGI